MRCDARQNVATIAGECSPRGIPIGRTNDFRTLQRADDLPPLQCRVVLELQGDLRDGRSALPCRAAGADHGCRAAAEVLGHPAGQPQHRHAHGRRSRLGRDGDDRRHAFPASRRATTHRVMPRPRQAGGSWRTRCDVNPRLLSPR